MAIDLIELSQDPRLDSWRELFDRAVPELEDIQELLNGPLRTNDPIFPKPENIFEAFKLTKLKDVKVVIFGQDPYVDMVGSNPRAMGLSFSSLGQNLPPSLKNIFNEIEREYKCKMVDPDDPNPGDLTFWCEQGVLLLNISLTVAKGSPNSHKGIWLGFIAKTIELIEVTNKNCIYVLWGREAIDFGKSVNLKGKILTSSHPSPHSYNKAFRDTKAFEGNGHFEKINKILEIQKKEPIKWCKH